MPKLCSLCRNLAIFALLCIRVTKVSFLATYKNLQFSAKIDYFWLGMDATRCLKAEIAKIVFTLSKFGDFWTILHQSHQS